MVIEHREQTVRSTVTEALLDLGVCKEADIRDEAHLFFDLGIDDECEDLVVDLEKRFGITMLPEEFNEVSTVGELIRYTLGCLGHSEEKRLARSEERKRLDEKDKRRLWMSVTGLGAWLALLLAFYYMNRIWFAWLVVASIVWALFVNSREGFRGWKQGRKWKREHQSGAKD